MAGYKHEMMFTDIGQNRVWESEKEELFDVTIDKDLKFEEGILELCEKAGLKHSALVRIYSILSRECWKILIKAFI